MILMKTGWVASFAATISTAAVLAMGPRAAVAQGLNCTDAEKIAAKCDASYKVSDLAGFKAPKAKKPYHLEFSVPMSFLTSRRSFTAPSSARRMRV